MVGLGIEVWEYVVAREVSFEVEVCRCRVRGGWRSERWRGVVEVVADERVQLQGQR